jgi:hypothetical protein
LTFDRSLAWLTLFSLLALSLHPSLAWADRLLSEPVSHRLPEKPIEVPSEESPLGKMGTVPIFNFLVGKGRQSPHQKKVRVSSSGPKKRTKE